MKSLSNNLSQEDMQQFLRVLSVRNEKSNIPVPPEIVESVKKVGGTFIANLLTGDSLTLDMQINHGYKDIQASYFKPLQVSSIHLNNVKLTEFEETNALKIVKAMKDLNEKDIDITGFSAEEILNTHGLIMAFSSGSNTNNLPEEGEAQALVDIWGKRD